MTGKIGDQRRIEIVQSKILLISARMIRRVLEKLGEVLSLRF